MLSSIFWQATGSGAIPDYPIPGMIDMRLGAAILLAVLALSAGILWNLARIARSGHGARTRRLRRAVVRRPRLVHPRSTAAHRPA